VSALHQPRAGDEVTDSWEAVDVVDLVENHAVSDLLSHGSRSSSDEGKMSRDIMTREVRSIEELMRFAGIYHRRVMWTLQNSLKMAAARQCGSQRNIRFLETKYL
jgi:hypothetical protein